MENVTLKEIFPVEHGNFETAGEVSSHIKRILKKLGITPNIVRDIAITAYEAEMNLVIHSDGGELVLEISPNEIQLTSRDCGPGIADIDQALKEGFSTAPESVRMMGFGAGMGLSNMKRHSHAFSIVSEVGKGTEITVTYNLS